MWPSSHEHVRFGIVPILSAANSISRALLKVAHREAPLLRCNSGSHQLRTCSMRGHAATRLPQMGCCVVCSVNSQIVGDLGKWPDLNIGRLLTASSAVGDKTEEQISRTRIVRAAHKLKGCPPTIWVPGGKKVLRRILSPSGKCGHGRPKPAIEAEFRDA